MVIATLYLIDLNRMKNNQEVLFSTWGRKYAPPEITKPKGESKMNIVLSLEDTISDNTAWCGTFNLIWNDLKNDLAKQDIEFTPQLEIVKNLNKGTFTTSQLSEESYYKVYGTPSLRLKKQIEQAIKEKFNETSDILDDFNWEGRDPNDYFLYAMLKKEFEFPKVFTELDKGRFGSYKEVSYFGINAETKEEVRDQVQVLYYNSKTDFAVKLITKTKDEVIITRGSKQNTFGSRYQEIQEKQKVYKGTQNFTENDKLKIPNITFDLKQEFQEIQNKSFYFSNGDKYSIEKALQTIQFELDKKGGKIKSEAGMMAKREAIILEPEKPREFIVDDTFTIFLKEKDKELPYFAANISDITKVQKEAKKEEIEQNRQEDTNDFYGTVIESNANSIIVEPREGEEIKKSADKISISLGEDNDAIYEVGTNVKVTYSGHVMETYPAQVNVVKIELKSAENFELRFYDKQPQSDEKFHTIINKSETERYDYNIYAYDGNINILIGKEEISLRKALLEGKITMNEIIAKANQDFPETSSAGYVKSYDDGGSMEYHYPNFTIIKMHTLDGNRDVFIGNKDMTMHKLSTSLSIQKDA